MTKVTSQEIAQFRSQLADDKSDMEALDLIEDCDGDLEDAAMTLAIRAGQQPERANSEWLDALARKWRAVICEQEYREDLLNSSLQKMMEHLKAMPTFPKILATPVLIYVLKQGVNNFCEPLDLLELNIDLTPNSFPTSVEE
ncbi:hypothetical protein LC605_20995 [Nostoc sp. CHAB 5836]|uniref:hypothetical protein n=1 Tax=Nostoc sp. CHAB 5836 TaxID=2780404 RepID=UPI001E2FE3C5|nr:hypothetical protein [Nostoc sp. CHAB 5836]MCC5617517.1 hypothetical protein [Nostoc sp. CHAB 5836]